MKFGKIVFALILSGAFISTAFSQDAVIQLSIKEHGKQQRPIVLFSHEHHADILECVRCHHDFDQYGNNLGSEGQPCSDCHTLAAGKNPIPLEEAFHIQCKSCHEQMLVQGTASGPIMCGECHVKE